MNMQNINTMAFKLTDSEVKFLQKEQPAIVPRKNGNFKMLRSLNGKAITHMDIFNTLYYEFFPEEDVLNSNRTDVAATKNKKLLKSLKPPRPQSTSLS